jgi:multiple sugar transport system substrate-binding protein
MRPRSLRQLPALTAFATFALGGAIAAQAQDGEAVTLTFANWAAAESATRPGIEKVIADFEAAHPNIKIESEALSFSEIARQLVLRVRSGNPPDVAQIAGNDTILMAATGGLEPLDSYAEDGTRDALKPAALSGLEVDGELIALPWNLAPAGFWYNKAIMEKAGLDPANPPATIEELMVAMEAIKESQPDVIPLGMDTTNRAFALSSNWPWMLTFGAVPIGEQATGADSEEMKSYLDWMRELAQQDFIDPGRKIGEFRPLAAQDKVAFQWDQVLLQGVIQSANGMSDEAFFDRWGVTTQPAGPSGDSFSFEGGHQLVMFADSEQKEAAWEFMKYLATAPDAIENYTISYNASLPPLAEVPETIAGELETPVFNAFENEIIPTIAAQPYGPAFATAATAIMAGVQEAVTGEKPIDEIAATIEQQLDAK